MDKYHWQELFERITAADPSTFAERIGEAEALLTSRLQELADSPDSQAEKQAIQESIKELGLIQIEKLGYPDWRKLRPN